jgi:hypothetical protein
VWHGCKSTFKGRRVRILVLSRFKPGLQTSITPLESCFFIGPIRDLTMRRSYGFRTFRILELAIVLTSPRGKSFRAGWMATITSDFCFFRPGVLAELATVFFSRRGDANAGYVCALLGFRARHDNPPLNLRTTHATLRGVSIARIRAVAVDQTKTCTRELRLPILPLLANIRKPPPEIGNQILAFAGDVNEPCGDSRPFDFAQGRALGCPVERSSAVPNH